MFQDHALLEGQIISFSVKHEKYFYDFLLLREYFLIRFWDSLLPRYTVIPNSYKSILLETTTFRSKIANQHLIISSLVIRSYHSCCSGHVDNILCYFFTSSYNVLCYKSTWITFKGSLFEGRSQSDCELFLWFRSGVYIHSELPAGLRVGSVQKNFHRHLVWLCGHKNSNDTYITS